LRYIILPNGLSSNRFNIRGYEPPKPVTAKIWRTAKNHIWIHYLAHSSLCLLRNALNGNTHPIYTPVQWLEKFKTRKKTVSTACRFCHGRGYVTRTDASTGEEVKIKCPKCNGTGSISKEVDLCPECEGSGVVVREDPAGNIVEIQCPYCNGKGGYDPDAVPQQET